MVALLRQVSLAKTISGLPLLSRSQLTKHNIVGSNTDMVFILSSFMAYGGGNTILWTSIKFLTYRYLYLHLT